MDGLKLRSRQWIVNEQGEMVMGEGRKRILETIEETGSINQAAKRLKMSYKGVWSKIKATESHLNIRLVRPEGRRGSYVTEEGKKLLQKYSRLKKECLQADDRIFKALFE
ncbi:MAG: LysR family transcriptional regulator [Desulfobacteraceae bacterium]|jgi:molybdate transport system regulatory protein